MYLSSWQFPPLVALLLFCITVVRLQATPLAAMSALWEAEAEIILVSRDPDAGRAADVVGVVTQTALARLLKTDEELSS